MVENAGISQRTGLSNAGPTNFRSLSRHTASDVYKQSQSARYFVRNEATTHRGSRDSVYARQLARFSIFGTTAASHRRFSHFGYVLAALSMDRASVVDRIIDLALVLHFAVSKK